MPFHPVPRCLTARDDTWHFTKRIVGQVHGIPTSRGVMVATNGILCLIEQGDGKEFLGHIGWFLADKEDEQQDVKKATKVSNAPLRSKYRLEIYDL